MWFGCRMFLKEGKESTERFDPQTFPFPIIYMHSMQNNQGNN